MKSNPKVAHGALTAVLDALSQPEVAEKVKEITSLSFTSSLHLLRRFAALSPETVNLSDEELTGLIKKSAPAYIKANLTFIQDAIKLNQKFSATLLDIAKKSSKNPKH
jgi:hypothetical protein